MKNKFLAILLCALVVCSTQYGVYALAELDGAQENNEQHNIVTLFSKPSKSSLGRKINRFINSHSKYKGLVVFSDEGTYESPSICLFPLRSQTTNVANVLVGSLRVNVNTGKCDVDYAYGNVDGFTIRIKGSGASSATSKYKKFIRKNGITSYKIVDVDGNGVKELCCNNCAYNEVYTYDSKKGKMKKLVSKPSGKVSNRPLVNTKKHQIRTWCGSYPASDEYKFYSIKGKKATLIKTITFVTVKKWNSDASKCTWKHSRYINGKKVSASVYDRELNKMSKGFK